MEEFGRREGQLVALARRTRLPRTAAVEPLARAPGAGQLLVDVVRNAGFECARPIGRRRESDARRRLDERGFLVVEKQIGRCQPVGAKAWSGGLSDRRRSGTGA